ncbi:MAG: RNA ligase [Bacteroidota bacterium]
MFEKFKKLEAEGLITLRANKTETLFIANYTPIVQYERLWDDLLIQCRGMILDAQGKTIARPFKKFFNIEEHQPEEIPNESFEVYDKLDGSLGILYFEKGEAKIATRGSFQSIQAEKATKLLYSQYKEYLAHFNEQHTYLFEIIYPENRIVVDYGKEEKLVLLAIIASQTGEELSTDDFDFPDKVKRYDGIKDLSKIRELEDNKREGFVVKFESGFRIKVKFSEYVRLHRIITQVSNKTIWEHLKDNKPFDELLNRVPDEFYDWVKMTRNKLQSDFDAILAEAKDTYRSDFGTKKDFALWAKAQKYPHILFSLYNGKDTDKYIWKMIKPTFEKPFREEV